MAHVNAAIQIVNIARIVYTTSDGDDIEITKKRLIRLLQHAIYVAHSINNGIDIVTIIDDQIEKMKNLICDNQNFQLLAAALHTMLRKLMMGRINKMNIGNN